MPDSLKLMAVLAHPDDESLGLGSTLAKYAAEGVQTSLVVATRGERGWQGDPDDFPGPQALGEIRTAELQEAARTLGLHDLAFLNYLDGDLDQADPREAIGKIVTHLRRVRPDVVMTFAADGGYGHPDHIAISQFTTAATVCAADASYRDAENRPPHRVAKLYYYVDTVEEMNGWFSLVGEFTFNVDGMERRFGGWEPWAVTTTIDGEPYWQQAWRAIQCHQSQLRSLGPVDTFSDEEHRRFWGIRHYYRAYSLVNGGRTPETDLLVGLR